MERGWLAASSWAQAGAGDAESSADLSSQKVGVLGQRTCFSVCHHRPEEQSLAGPETVTASIVQAGKLRPAGHEACPNRRASEQHCGIGLGLRAPPPPHLPRGHVLSPAPSVITPKGVPPSWGWTLVTQEGIT